MSGLSPEDERNLEAAETIINFSRVAIRFREVADDPTPNLDLVGTESYQQIRGDIGSNASARHDEERQRGQEATRRDIRSWLNYLDLYSVAPAAPSNKVNNLAASSQRPADTSHVGRDNEESGPATLQNNTRTNYNNLHLPPRPLDTTGRHRNPVKEGQTSSLGLQPKSRAQRPSGDEVSSEESDSINESGTAARSQNVPYYTRSDRANYEALRKRLEKLSKNLSAHHFISGLRLYDGRIQNCLKTFEVSLSAPIMTTL
ncbi:hypothetical protein F4677DRAFT_358635 [Hypoxylon crocopeplum]|nr:hypothetical protein F4677DRAFT_358635 [Hypoxylon crocopeplum]